jgi:hypothetical protein
MTNRKADTDGLRK